MSGERCETCRFWRKWPTRKDADGEVPVGTCRRFPPVIVANEEIQPAPDDDIRLSSTMYPATYGDDWCGEFQPKLPVRPTVPLTEHYRKLNLGNRENSAIQSFFRGQKTDDQITVGDVASISHEEILMQPRAGSFTARRIQLAVASATGIVMREYP